MAVIITTSLISLLFVILSKFEKRIDWFKLAFLIVIFVACIHYNYGNDYKGYYWNWTFISENSLKSLLSASRFSFYNYAKPETGWIVLNKIFSFKNGFYYMVAALNIIEGVIYYKFIKKFVPQKLYVWAFFLYIFTYKYYLLNFSMMRQGFSMAIVLLSFMYFCDKSYKKTIIAIAIAVSIHSAAIIMIPVFIICKFEEKIRLRTFSLIILVLTVLIFLASSFSSRIFNLLISLSFFSDYKTFYAGTLSTNTIGLGFVLLSIPYIVMIYYMIFNSKDITTDYRYLIVLAYIAFLTKPFEFVGAALVTRIGYYFSIFDIAIVPILYSRIKRPLVRYILFFSLLAITIYTYFGFYSDPTYQEAFSEFHSIFEFFK